MAPALARDRARLTEVTVGIEPTGEDDESPGVDPLVGRRQIPLVLEQRRNPAISYQDGRPEHTVLGGDGPTGDPYRKHDRHLQ